MKPLWIALGLALTLAAPAPAADDFDAGQSAALTQNPAGLICALSLPDGKTQFQQGEVIRLTLSFTSDRPGAYQMRRWPFERMDSPHVSPSEGTADPMADVPPPRFFSYNGPPPPAPVAIGNKPVTVPMTVNERLRFDKPGTYRLYVTSSRVTDGKVKVNNPFDAGKTITTASNVVQFQIVPADPAWAHAQAQAALVEVQDHYTGPMTVSDPWDVLRYLGTPESARALLSILGADKYPRSSESKGEECRRFLSEEGKRRRAATADVLAAGRRGRSEEEQHGPAHDPAHVAGRRLAEPRRRTERRGAGAGTVTDAAHGAGLRPAAAAAAELSAGR